MKRNDWFLLCIVIIAFEFMLFMLTKFGFALVVNGMLVLFVFSLFAHILGVKNNVVAKNELTPNQFHKILISCIEEHYVLSDPNWHWEIIEFENERHTYHVIGSHPTCKRIDVIKQVIV